jgi:long-chain acyl-CoA synthetase
VGENRWAAEGRDTFPKLLALNAQRFGNRPASREKMYGIWQAWSWAQVNEETRALATGLMELGLAPGERMAIVGTNRPPLYWSMVAAQMVGAVPVPIYQDSVADEMAFVLEHAEARFAVVEDQEQVDKLLEVKGRCPILEQIVYDESRGLRHYTQPFLHHFDAVQAEGRDYNKVHPDFYDDFIAKGKGNDPAVILYTSGTTGKPKGVILSFDNVVKTAANGVKLENLTDREESVAYLPMAWVGDHIFSYGQSYVAGFCVACPESSATVMQDLRELGPTYFFAPPRIFENILTTVMIRMSDASWLKRRMFKYFMEVARR